MTKLKIKIAKNGLFRILINLIIKHYKDKTYFYTDQIHKSYKYFNFQTFLIY